MTTKKNVGNASGPTKLTEDQTQTVEFLLENGATKIDAFPSCAYEVYRQSTVGVTLLESLTDLILSKALNEDMACMVVRHFDYAVIKVIRSCSSMDEPVVLQAEKIKGFRSWPQSGRVGYVLENVDVNRNYDCRTVAAHHVGQAAMKTANKKTAKRGRNKKKVASELVLKTKESYIFYTRIETKVPKVLLMAYSAMAEHFPTGKTIFNDQLYVPVQEDRILNSHILYVCYKFVQERKKENKDAESEVERQAEAPFRFKNLRSVEYNPQSQACVPLSKSSGPAGSLTAFKNRMTLKNPTLASSGSGTKTTGQSSASKFLVKMSRPSSFAKKRNDPK